MDSSVKGLPGAAILCVECLTFLAIVGLTDRWLMRRYGVQRTMTYGFRWLAQHIPLAWTSIVFAVGWILGALAMHFAESLYVP